MPYAATNPIYHQRRPAAVDLDSSPMMRLALMLVGFASTALAIAGALLPALPTTPFVLVALWAFARSSQSLHDWLLRIPLLRGALVEARRFETEGSVRGSVKVTALSFAWGSVLVCALTTEGQRPILLALLVVAAVAATVFMWWTPTAREQ
ncbi:MAG: YbaN family protein [Hyphomicrobiaceae bacterium]